MANRVWFDARSLSRRYTTGWERYARELALHVPKLIDTTLWNPNTHNRLALLLSDFQTTKSQNGHQVVHFPTYPPRNKNVETSQVITVHDLTWWKYPETSSFLCRFRILSWTFRRIRICPGYKVYYYSTHTRNLSKYLHIDKFKLIILKI